MCVCVCVCVPAGCAGGRGAASTVKSLPVVLPLTTPALVLKRRLVVGDDGDDLLLKRGRQAEGHGVDLGVTRSQVRHRFIEDLFSMSSSLVSLRRQALTWDFLLGV